MKTRIALIGYGKMGQRIHALSKEREDVEVVLILDERNNVNGSGITPEAFAHVDVAIDFTHPSIILSHLDKLIALKKPVVVGTTGWNTHIPEVKERCEKEGGTVLYGSNFSIGVQLFFKLVRQAGMLYGKSSGFEASLHEVHHTQKADAPSGTGITLAEQYLRGADSQKSIQYGVAEKGKVNTESTFIITSQRLGSVIGDHELRVDSPFDDIQLVHRAKNRDGFASGALRASIWLAKQAPGFYQIEDIVEEL